MRASRPGFDSECVHQNREPVLRDGLGCRSNRNTTSGGTNKLFFSCTTIYRTIVEMNRIVFELNFLGCLTINVRQNGWKEASFSCSARICDEGPPRRLEGLASAISVSLHRTEMPPILAVKFMHSPVFFRHSQARLAALSSSLAGHTSDLNEWRTGFCASPFAGETSVVATAFSCVTGVGRWSP
jgi:hypothetical protein